MIQIGRLEPRDRGAAIDLLSRAFRDDRGMQAIVGADAAQLSSWFAATLDLIAPPSGDILVANGPEGLCGVLVWSGPVQPRASQRWRWLKRVVAQVGPLPAWRTVQHDRRRQAAMPRGASIVEFVAVERAARGQGIAGQLFDACHTASGHWWLETTRPENLPIFARLGYRETERRQEGGVTYHAMERIAP